MCAAMRVAVDVATALNVFPEREAADGENVEHVFNAFVVGLVIYNHDCFHKAMLCFCVMYVIVLGENMVGCDVVGASQAHSPLGMFSRRG